MVTAMEVIPTISNPITIIIRMVTVATAVTGVIMVAIEAVTAAIEAGITINHWD